MPQTGIEPVREYKSRRILSPVRLPVPPLRHVMDGGGFEPPKALLTDLQSAPFGHSGTHPCVRFFNLTINTYIIFYLKMQLLFQFLYCRMIAELLLIFKVTSPFSTRYLSSFVK